MRQRPTAFGCSRFPTLVLPSSGFEGRPFGRTLSRVAPLASGWNRIASLLHCQRGIRPSSVITTLATGVQAERLSSDNTSKGGIHFALVPPHCHGWAGWQRIPSRVLILQPRWSNSTSGCPPRRPAATVSSEFAGPRASRAPHAALRRLGAPGGSSSDARSASARPLQRQARSSRALGNRCAQGSTRCGPSRVRRRA